MTEVSRRTARPGGARSDGGPRAKEPGDGAAEGDAATRTATPIVDSWHRRAAAYGRLVECTPLFRELAADLIDLTGDRLHRAHRALDLGGGTGLLSRLLLGRQAGLEVTLLEPAPAMRALAATALAGRPVSVVDGRAEACHRLGGVFDVILSNAVVHLLEEDRVLAAAAQVLASDGVLAFNLWDHSFEETAAVARARAASGERPAWRGAVEDVLRARGHPTPVWPAPAPPRVRTRAGLAAAARRAHLELVEVRNAEYPVPERFSLDFAAMSPDFLGNLDPGERGRVLAASADRLSGDTAIGAAHFLFRPRLLTGTPPAGR